MSWLEELYEEENESVVIRKIRDNMDWLAFSDDRNAINKILDTVDVEKVPASGLLTFLKILKPLKHRITSYAFFFNLVSPLIVEKLGEGIKEELEQYQPI